jgi:hypothetical protein
LIALGASMILGAERAGISSALRDELALSQPQLFASFSKSIPDMFQKAHRWVAEMEEISDFLGSDRPEGKMFAEIGALYGHLADETSQPEIEALARFFAPQNSDQKLS